jgi:hypothetical protein
MNLWQAGRKEYHAFFIMQSCYNFAPWLDAPEGAMGFYYI